MRSSRHVVIVIALLGSLLPASVRAMNFQDVPSDYKNAQAIEALSDAGLVSGYPDGRFLPDNTISRSEAIKILVSALETPEAIASALSEHRAERHTFIDFHDIKPDAWSAPYIELAYRRGMVQGYADGNFKPANGINFAEGLKMILSAYQMNVADAPFRQNPLLYVNTGDWFAPYFMTASEKNLLNPVKFYHPSQAMKRGEFVEVLYRLQTIQAQRLTHYSAPISPTSNEYTITIPRLNIIGVPVGFADPFNEKDALAVLKEGFGHYLSPPGSGKKMVLFGHSSGYSWDHSAYKTILKPIDKLQTGDEIFINYHEHGYAYTINKTEIIPAKEAGRLMQDQDKPELDLYTCWPPNRIDYRYVVYGQPM